MSRLKTVRIAIPRRVSALAVVGAAVLLMIAIPANAGNILFLGDLDGDANGDGAVAANAAADTAMIAHLAALGHTVTALDDSVAVPADQAGKDLIVISATVGSGNAKTALVGAASNFQGVSLPIVCMEPGNGDEMGLNIAAGMLGYPQGQHNSQTLALTAAGQAHPIGSGVPGGTQDVFASALEMIHWYYINEPGYAAYGAPAYTGAPGAATLGTDANFYPNGSADLVLVDPGQMLGYGQAAPAKRIGLFVGRGSFDDLTPIGLQLFDNTIAYAIPEPATMAFIALGAAMLTKRGRRGRASEA